MKKIIKKVLSLLLVSSMVVSMAACGTPNKETANTNDAKADSKTEDKVDTAKDDKAEKVVINAWHQWANDTNELKQIYDKAVADYMAANPNIEINTQTLDTEAYKTKISTEFAGSAKGVDVFYYWGAGTASKFLKADKLLPIDEYITQETKDKIKPGSTSAFEYEGKLYSLPTFAWYMTLFCNSELFEQAGAKIPDTYEEFVDAVEKLATLDGIVPLVSGAKDGWNAGFIYEAIALREVGSENLNKMLSGEVPFEDEGFTEAAKKLVELYNMGAFGKNPLEGGSNEADAAFVGGKAGMRLMGSWFANNVYADKASVVQGKVVAKNIPMISGKGSAVDYAGGFIESFWVNKNTQHPKEAAEFAIYINEAMAKGAYETGTGFSGWDVPTDDSQLNELFVQVDTISKDYTDGVLAWDTSLDSNTAAIHLELVQSLFSKSADVDKFIQGHKDAINK